MAIQYKEVLQEDEDELIQDCKNCDQSKNKKDCKNNFESVKCELLEDEEDEDEVIMWTWSEIGKRLVAFLLVLCVMILFHFTFYILITSLSNMVWGHNDQLGIENDEILMRQEDYLMRKRLEEEELRHLGRLDLLRMEMEEIGNKEMAAEYRDKSYWFKLKMEKLEAYIQEG